MKKMADIMSKTGKWLLVFGFVFSQISFPIEVLAEELTTEENTYEEVILEDNSDVVIEEETNNEVVEENTDSDIPVNETVINIEELTDYTISIDEVTTVVFNYQGIECERIDFSNKLYGTYEYTLTLEETITITINYEGNNATLLESYKLGTDESKNISFTNDKCIITGFEESLVSVDSITTDYYDLEKFSNDYNASIEVIGTDNEPLYTGAVLRSGYNLVILNNSVEEILTNGILVSSNQKAMYTIVNDQEEIVTNIIEEKEVTSMTDVNGDEVLSILDATNSLYIEVEKVETEEVLTNELTSSSEEVLVGETVEVKLFVKGFDKLSLYGIEGLLNYDKNVLELVDYNLYQTENTLGDLNLENSKFAYVLNDGFNNGEEAILTLTFEAIQEGMSEVTISNIINSYGEDASQVESVNTTINIDAPEDNKGGDEEEIPEDTTTEEEENTDATEEEVEEVVTKPVVRPVVLSSDYYIKSLSIDGYEIDFDMDTFEYSIKVGSDVTSLDLEVLLNDNNSIYYVEGNENFEVGENLVHITVKAENGSTKTYTIKVEKEKEVVKEEKNELDEEIEEDEEENSTSKTVIIILIILVIIGLIYVIFKDDEEDNKQTEKKKETEKPKVEKVKVEKVEKVKTESSKQTKQTKQQPKKTSSSSNNSKSKTTKKTNKK